MALIGGDRAEGFCNGESKNALNVVQVAGPCEAGGSLCPNSFLC